MTAFTANFKSSKDMIHLCQTLSELFGRISTDFFNFLIAGNQAGKKLNIALSGGSTPRAFFERIAEDQQNQHEIPWSLVHFFWVDERCVPPSDAESNYGMTQSALLSRINLPEGNIHRIHGENDPEEESLRYSHEIEKNVKFEAGLPVFDWIFLGIGNDGHTASIFPGRTDLLNATSICKAVRHPVTGQGRITLTGKPIVSAKKLTFLVTGESKSLVVGQIINKEPAASDYPAAYIARNRQDAEWYLDASAATYIKSL